MSLPMGTAGMGRAEARVAYVFRIMEKLALIESEFDKRVCLRPLPDAHYLVIAGRRQDLFGGVDRSLHVRVAIS